MATLLLGALLTDVARPAEVNWSVLAGELSLAGWGLFAILAGNLLTLAAQLPELENVETADQIRNLSNLKAVADAFSIERELMVVALSENEISTKSVKDLTNAEAAWVKASSAFYSGASPELQAELDRVSEGTFDKGSGALCLSDTHATLADTGGDWVSAPRCWAMRRATCCAAGSSVSGSTTANSSPPKRAAVSMSRHDANKASATRHSARLPTTWPWRSLMTFRPSR